MDETGFYPEPTDSLDGRVVLVTGAAGANARNIG
jgi:hypothetical protein